MKVGFNMSHKEYQFLLKTMKVRMQLEMDSEIWVGQEPYKGWFKAERDGLAEMLWDCRAIARKSLREGA